MKKILLHLFVSFSFSFANLSESVFTQNDFQVLEDFDIDSSYILDEHLQDVYYKLLKNNNHSYIRRLNQASSFIPVVKTTLEHENMSSNFLFMAMAESNFILDAKSSVNAKGIWQFMPATAKRFDLKINDFVDERMDLIKSTKAASRYLKENYKKFGKWYLSILAYNCGEGRIIEAITRATLDKYVERNPELKKDKKILEYRHTIKRYTQKEEKFYKLYRIYKEMKKLNITLTLNDILHRQKNLDRQYLPRESRLYLRKIIVYAMLNNNEVVRSKNHAYILKNGVISIYAKIDVRGGLHLKSLSNALNIDENDLYKINKHLKHKITPVSSNKYGVYIPYDKLLKYSKIKNTIKDDIYTIHRVKKNETLSDIGDIYHVKYSIIKKFNKLKNNFLSLNQKLVIPIEKGTHLPVIRKHKIKRGDTLESISKYYKVDIDKLMKDNKLKKTIIRLGDNLDIYK